MPGTHTCLEGNSRALATVTAIIDGTGSIGLENTSTIIKQELSFPMFIDRCCGWTYASWPSVIIGLAECILYAHHL